MKPRTCVGCGRTFAYRREPGQPRDYCSVACRKAAASRMHLANRRERPPYRVCAACGGGFLAATARRTCSDECERDRRAANARRSYLVMAQPRWRQAAAA